MLFKHFEYGSLRCSRQTRSWIYHFICDVTVTSFYKIDTKFVHNIHHISRCVFQVSFFYAFALRRYCEKNNWGKNMPPPPPAAGGWRGGPAAAGLNISMTIHHDSREEKLFQFAKLRSRKSPDQTEAKHVITDAESKQLTTKLHMFSNKVRQDEICPVAAHVLVIVHYERGRRPNEFSLNMIIF